MARSAVIFRRRQPQAQLIVSTNALRHVSSHMPPPTGPLLPMSDGAPRASEVPPADVTAAVRDSGTVIAFLAAGGTRAHLTVRAYDVISRQDGCGLGLSSSLTAFAEQYCDTADGQRRLIQLLAVHRPSNNPTALLTRMAITGWVRTVGIAAQPREAVDPSSSGLPDWHTPGDM